MSKAQRTLHAKLKAGREWKGDLHVALYKKLGISSVHLDMAYRQLLGKLGSIKELAKDNAADIRDRIASKQSDIRKKQKALAKKINKRHESRAAHEAASLQVVAWKSKLKSEAEGTRQYETCLSALKRFIGKREVILREQRKAWADARKLRFSLHQHKRKLTNLEHKLEKAIRQMEDPSICFGSRKHFNAQHHLAENGHADHREWLQDWRTCRDRQFRLDGNARREGGNDFARLSYDEKDAFSLELRLPEALRPLGKQGKRGVSFVRLQHLSFLHGEREILAALENRQPVTVMFRRDEKSWKIHVTVDDALERVAFDDTLGVIGIDINVGFLAVTRADRFGNPVESFNIPFVTHGRSSDQSLDAARKAAAFIAAYASKHGLPVVCESLDFGRKKKSLKDERNARYARMLSSFAFSSISAALGSACARSGIPLRRVNPAYTSLMGRVKFARRYGLSVHAAAALCIARRAKNLSESVPLNQEGTVSVPSDDGSVVTLRAPARKRVRHVWSVWSAINAEKKKVFATRGSTGRKSRPPHGSGRARGSGPVGSSGTFPVGSDSIMSPGLWDMSQDENHAGRRKNNAR